MSASIRRMRWLISESAIERLLDTVVLPSPGLALEMTNTRGLCSENMIDVNTVRKLSAIKDPGLCHVTNSTGLPSLLAVPSPVGISAAGLCPRCIDVRYDVPTPY